MDLSFVQTPDFSKEFSQLLDKNSLESRLEATLSQDLAEF